MEYHRENETWDDLLRDEMGIVQPVSGYRFTMDAVLLAYFAAQLPARQILDLGTGCGVVALLLASRVREAQVTGVEIQAEQAERACRSVEANQLATRIKIVHGDLKNPDLFQDNFDLITMNPPFYPLGSGKLPLQKSIAISRHEIECTLEDVFNAVVRWLAPDGRFCMVLPPSRKPEADLYAKHCGLSLVRQCAVHPRVGRAANLFLLEYQANSTEMVELSPLYVYKSDGEYTPEIIDIYYHS